MGMLGWVLGNSMISDVANNLSLLPITEEEIMTAEVPFNLRNC